MAQVEEVELIIPAFGESLRWTAEVSFFLQDWNMTFGLLGQSGFFDHWVVSFDYPSTFVIEERQSYQSRSPSLDVEQIQEIWEWQDLGWKGPPPARS